MEKLPERVAGGAPESPAKSVLGRGGSIVRQFAGARETNGARFVAMNEVAGQRPGFVMDFIVVLNSASNFTFDDATTYHVTGNVWMTGNTVFEAGTVLKFSTGGKVSLYDGTVSGAGAILTSEHDQSAGESVNSGSQSGRYGVSYLSFYYIHAKPTLSNFQFRFANEAVESYTDEVYFYNARFVACDRAIAAYYTAWELAYSTYCVVPTTFYDYGNSALTVTGFFWEDCQYFDSDADGFSDGFELTHFGTFNQTPATDYDGDGLANGWEWDHFGTFSQNGSGDYDQDGWTNLQEQNAGSDPNSIVFDPQFADDHFSGNTAGFTVDLRKGVPASIAILVDSSNFAGAAWNPYVANGSVSLGGTDGGKQVWIG
ncbi:MAG TPA: hypothetical protein DCY13_07440 [Verrucomicrobiales bacterium]|nr:hypothetical protein [Verrucomicrobiales bacterium]